MQSCVVCWKSAINLITKPKPIYSHTQSCDNISKAELLDTSMETKVTIQETSFDTGAFFFPQSCLLKAWHNLKDILYKIQMFFTQDDW
jgi:hypothetical protein